MTNESPQAAAELKGSPLSCPVKLDDSLLESGTARPSTVWSVNSSDSSLSSCTSSGFVDRLFRSCDVWEGRQRFLNTTMTKPNTTTNKMAISNVTIREGSVGLFEPDLLLFSPKEKQCSVNDVISQSGRHPVSQSVNQSASQVVSRSVSQTVSQSVSQSVSKLVKSVSQSVI